MKLTPEDEAFILMRDFPTAEGTFNMHVSCDDGNSDLAMKWLNAFIAWYNKALAFKKEIWVGSDEGQSTENLGGGRKEIEGGARLVVKDTLGLLESGVEIRERGDADTEHAVEGRREVPEG